MAEITRLDSKEGSLRFKLSPGIRLMSAYGFVAVFSFLLGMIPAAIAGPVASGTGPWVIQPQQSDAAAKVLAEVKRLEASGEYVRAEAEIARAAHALQTDQSESGLVDLVALQTRRATFLMRLCRFAEAESTLVPLLDRMESRFGRDAAELIPVINALGEVYFLLGDYVQADRSFRRSLVLTRRNYGNDDRFAVAALQGLARVLHRTWRLAKAEQFAERSYKACHATDSFPPLVRAGAADCLGLTRRASGQYDEAERLFHAALGIVDSAYGPDHPAAAVYHNRLAALYVNLRRAEDAEREARIALEIATRRLGPGNLETASALYNQALGIMFRDSSANLASQFERVLSIRTRCLGKNHPDNAGIYEYFGLYHRMRGAYAEALKLARTAAAMRRADYTQNSRDMIDYDAAVYSTAYHYSVSDLPSYYFDSGVKDSSLQAELVSELLTANGYAFDDLLQRRRCQGSLTNDADRRLVDKLQQIRAEKAALFLRDPMRLDSATGPMTDSLEWAEQDEMSALSDRIQECRSSKLEKSVTCEDIARLLPPGSVYVDFINYLYVQPSRIYHEEARYAAVVIGPSGLRGMVPLGAVRVDTLILRLNRLMKQREAGSGDMTASSSAGVDSLTRILYDKLWAPIDALVPDSLVLLSYELADFDLSFASLQDPHGEFLAGSHAFQYIDMGRDFLRLGLPRVKANNRLLALGDPDYNASPLARMTASATVAHFDSLRPTGYVARNVRSSCQDFGDLLLSSLPGTRTEVMRVADDWKSTRGREADVVTGAAASEEAVKWLAPGHRVVHLATHGYYLPEECGAPSPTPPGHQPEGTPLRRTGLLLAGANLRGEGAELAGAEDGVLTTEEVSSLQLEGTDLVILSACESGVGFHVRSQGGAFGLRRAFQVAGARTVISSIWPVGDHTTLELMDRIYKDTTQTYAAILSQYARDKIRQARAAGKFPDPSEWAAFVVSGDWRR